MMGAALAAGGAEGAGPEDEVAGGAEAASGSGNDSGALGGLAVASACKGGRGCEFAGGVEAGIACASAVAGRLSLAAAWTGVVEESASGGNAGLDTPEVSAVRTV